MNWLKNSQMHKFQFTFEIQPQKSPKNSATQKATSGELGLSMKKVFFPGNIGFSKKAKSRFRKAQTSRMVSQNCQKTQELESGIIFSSQSLISSRINSSFELKSCRATIS